ncbi:flavin reductase family protein [Aeoliella mucimassa]|uniref:Diflavin flavoprotein A 1 n=1 Tax=Aeoliella mucimassa TaxID=2527972 RepID=A0A518ARS3_9BACT|nr:flavin reductase family protein [Aeoliella mucimassa]QDU57433.1 Diflavin flavoprotein A 1 [Aeoliella mucimassa]
MSDTDLLSPLGRVPSGIFILTVGTGERATGMLASWVMQAGFEPPMVSVAVKQGRYVCDWLSEGQPFVLNLVGDGQTDFLKHFGKGFEPGVPAFEGVATAACRTGVPMLSQALGHLECEPAGHLDSGDHRIFLARVVRGGMTGEGQPMVHIRKSGANY